MLPKLTGNAIGIEHSVANGNTMTGVASADTDASFNKDRAVIVHDQLASSGEGLFDPAPYAGNENPYCTFVQIMSESGLSWTVYVTSGLGDGTASTVDDPTYDQEILAGSGSAHKRVNVELLPTQKIRIVTNAAASDDIRCIVHFASTMNCGGRLIS